MITHTHENGVDHYRYNSPSKEDLYAKMRILDELLDKFVKYHSELNSDIYAVDYKILGDSLVRVDQRKEKFKIFHDETIMNEIKEVALLAYWIIKMKPLKIIQVDNFKKYRYINENFATFLILSTLCEEAYRDGKKFALTKEYSRKLMYSLKFWNLGIDSFISVVEALNECPRH